MARCYIRRDIKISFIQISFIHSFIHSFSLLFDFQRRKCFNPLDYLSAYLFRYNSLIPYIILTKVCSYSNLDHRLT